MLCHLGGVEPDAHGIIGAIDVHFAHTRHAAQARLDIDFEVVVEEGEVVGAIRGVQA